MNILVIGNGFDLAHGLPTSYKDFIDCCKKIDLLFSPCTHGKLDKSLIIKNHMNPLLKERIEYIYENGTVIVGASSDHSYKIYTIDSTFDKTLNEMYECIKKNMWYKLFLDKSSLNNTWIDFEKEISIVIQSLNELIAQNPNDTKRFVRKYCNIFKIKFSKQYGKISDCINSLEEDLTKLIRALEIYLHEFVEKYPISKINLFNELQVEYVLSFNYTHTYNVLYDHIVRHSDRSGEDMKVACSYIHGQTSDSSSLENNNMVLGIDEYLPEERRDSELSFISFKKYFQRIYKGTGNEYLNWIKNLQKDLSRNSDRIKESINYELSEDIFKERSVAKTRFSNIYIFGHSLDITDGDVLRKFILSDYVKTNIFYYREYEDDKRDLKQKITNLVKIIGQEELIKRTGGPTRTIEFIPQELPK